MALDLETYIGVEEDADEYDVRKVKVALNRLGYYTPDEKTGITGDGEPEFYEAVKTFQRRHGITASGRISPGSVTQRVLDAVLEEHGGQVLPGWYIWRTVGDEKVRGAACSAERAGLYLGHPTGRRPPGRGL